VQGFTVAEVPDLYPVPLGGFDLDLAARLELVLRVDRSGAGKLFRGAAADSGLLVQTVRLRAIPSRCAA
jgi:hypothetical protein